MIQKHKPQVSISSGLHEKLQSLREPGESTSEAVERILSAALGIEVESRPTASGYIDGWHAIAAFMGRPKQWCVAASQRRRNPMPVTRPGHGGRRAYMLRSEAVAWRESEDSRVLLSKVSAARGEPNVPAVSLRPTTLRRIKALASAVELPVTDTFDAFLNHCLDRAVAA